MFNRHDILELPAIPRERAQLQATIGAARYTRRRRRIIYTTAAIAVGLGILILLWRFGLVGVV